MKNQIRSFFGRLARKRLTERRNQEVDNDKNDKISRSSDEDVAEHYFRTEQNQELEDMKAD